MAFTTTTLINASSKAAGTPVKVANNVATVLQTTTGSFTLFAKLTTTGKCSVQNVIKLFYANVPYDATDGTSEQVPLCARELELKPGPKPGQASVVCTAPIPIVATHLHTWLEIPNLEYATTVTVTLVETTFGHGQLKH